MEALLPLLLIHLHVVLLLVRHQPSLLGLELLHALVDGPWSLEIPAACLTKLLPCLFELSSLCFARSLLSCASVLANHQGRCDTCSISWVHGSARVVEHDSLLVELHSIQLGLLNETSEVVLACLDFGFSLESADLLEVLVHLEIGDVDVWR